MLKREMYGRWLEECVTAYLISDLWNPNGVVLRFVAEKKSSKQNKHQLWQLLPMVCVWVEAKKN